VCDRQWISSHCARFTNFELTDTKEKETTFSLRITKGEPIPGIPGKSSRNFEPIAHMYLEITEASTNVTLIKAAVQKTWGKIVY